MLIQQIQQLDKVPDYLTGCNVLIRADASVFDFDKYSEIFRCNSAGTAIQACMHFRKFLAEHQHFLRSQRLQTDHRRQQIPCAGL